MEALFIYLLRSSASLLVLFAIYWWLLRKETCFALNRVSLVLVLLISTMLPALPLRMPVSGGAAGLAYILDPVLVSAGSSPGQDGGALNLSGWLMAAWLAGGLVMLVRLVIRIGTILRLAGQSGRTEYLGQKLVLVTGDQGPFSFFNMVFIGNANLRSRAIPIILGHEKVHIKQWHTADLVLAELVTALHWFNPVVWLIRKEIRTVHEYLADDGVLQKGINRQAYQQILLDETMGLRVDCLTNHFNVSLLKNRIAMMTRPKSKGWARSKVFIALPLMLLLGFILTTGTGSNLKELKIEKPVGFQVEQPSVSSPQVQDKSKQQQIKYVAPVVTDNNTAHQEVDKMPAFPGGDDARVKYFVENIRYPEAALKKGTQGTVFVTFIVKTDGSIESVKILRGIGDGCDEEALRVVKMMPKWTPGELKGKPVDVSFNMPIKFALEKKKTGEPK